MGSTQRNVIVNQQIAQNVEFYNSMLVNMRVENPRSKFINNIESSKPHKSRKAKKATKKKRRR